MNIEKMPNHELLLKFSSKIDQFWKLATSILDDDSRSDNEKECARVLYEMARRFHNENKPAPPAPNEADPVTLMGIDIWLTRYIHLEQLMEGQGVNCNYIRAMTEPEIFEEASKTWITQPR